MRRIVLSLLVLAVFLPSVAFARVAYLCVIDGQSRPSCCCPPKKHDRTQVPASTMSASCCKISSVSPAKSEALPETARTTIDSPSVVAIVPALVPLHAPDRVLAVSPRAQAPPEHSRPLYTSHCALLL